MNASHSHSTHDKQTTDARKMNRSQINVRDFYKTYNYFMRDFPSCDLPSVVSDSVLKAIEEKREQLEDAIGFAEISDIALAIGELLYVSYAAAVSFGIDIEPIFAEVHRSKMTRKGGRLVGNKWVDSINSSPPHVESIITNQIPPEVL